MVKAVNVRLVVALPASLRVGGDGTHNAPVRGLGEGGLHGGVVGVCRNNKSFVVDLGGVSADPPFEVLGVVIFFERVGSVVGFVRRADLDQVRVVAVHLLRPRRKLCYFKGGRLFQNL